MKEKQLGGFRQFIKFALLGIISSAVELSLFVLLNFVVFKSLKDTEFSWWILNYSKARGGLGALYAIIISYAAGQTVNFFVQRKNTFKANNNPALSAVLFALMVIGVWLFQMYIGGILIGWLTPILGDTWGTILAKSSTMTLSLAITFPLNKYVIMRRKKPDNQK